jgi:lysyl-tRNA synthetase class II
MRSIELDTLVPTTATELHAQYADVTQVVEGHDSVVTGGTILFRNGFGNAMFWQLKDAEVTRVRKDTGGNMVRTGFIQVYIAPEHLGKEVFEQVKNLPLDTLVWVKGTVCRPRHGELTVEANSIYSSEGNKYE